MHIKNQNDLNILLDKISTSLPKDQKAVAAFDADGTLWDIDMGENFFQYVIDNKLVPLPADPWKHYRNMQVEVSKEAAYIWLAQIFEGVEVPQVQQWAKEAVESVQPVPVFDFQKKLIQHLLSLNVDVYIVTASIKWAVEPAASLVGLTPEKVLGIEVQTPGGLVGLEQKGILTYKAGKAERIVEESGVRPFFSAGNTEGDYDLLMSATDLRFVICNTDKDHENHPTESKMIELAKKEGWFYHLKYE
ncbi:MAG TPA: haloacid dehalogenase [Bdellovibrionales bacterium]|nr:haloacid dehalogenase [Bdellovibrionales bacterium]|tara:strand:+ start:895 stop:1635 length:741 start_codon:yes stop_codon:yes gene_type:complete